MNYYAVKVNGKMASVPLTSIQAAESFKDLLKESDKATAIVIPVTEEGTEILFG